MRSGLLRLALLRILPTRLVPFLAILELVRFVLHMRRLRRRLRSLRRPMRR